MIDWLLANKEWVFSGVGVVVVVAVLGFARKLMSRPAVTGPLRPSQSPADYRKLPLPKEIRSDVENTPPAQRRAKEQGYVGLRVEWETTLEYARDRAGGSVHLMLLDRGHYPWVYCDVSLDHYPELRVAKRGTRITVRGSIASVDGNTIVVNPAQLIVGDHTV